MSAARTAALSWSQLCEVVMVIVSEETIEEHLRVVEVCENEHSVIIGDLPLISIDASREEVRDVEVGERVSVRFMSVHTSLGTAEVEVYHVMGTTVAISFILRIKGCGHNLASIYAEVIKALRSEGSK